MGLAFNLGQVRKNRPHTYLGWVCLLSSLAKVILDSTGTELTSSSRPPRIDTICVALQLPDAASYNHHKSPSPYVWDLRDLRLGMQ